MLPQKRVIRERMLPFSKQMYRETPTASKYNLDENAYDKKMRREMLTENKLALANMYSGSSETLCKANISARRTKPRFLSVEVLIQTNFSL